MSIFEKIFGTTPPSQPAQMQPPGQTPQSQGPLPGSNPANPTVPAQGSQSATPPEPNPNASPLDAHKDVWQTPNTPTETSQSIFANLDPAKLQEAARKVNFTSVVTPEQLQAISQGGEASINAFKEALNTVAQTVYGQSALSTTKIVEQALAKQAEQFNSQLPSLVKKLSANESLLASNPAFQNPAVAPIVQALQDTLVRKNPNATAAELNQQMADFFGAMGSAFAPKPAAQTANPSGNKAAKDEDWSKFFE